jgi:hypothetical protein
MSPSQIKQLAADIRQAHPELKDVDLESLLAQSIAKSGVSPFLHYFARPTAWISGFIGLYVDGLLPEDSAVRLLSGLTIGATVEWASDYVKKRSVTIEPLSEPAVLLGSAHQLYAAETKDITRRLFQSTANDLSSTGFAPRIYAEPAEQREARMVRAVYRHAMSNPRLRALVV